MNDELRAQPSNSCRQVVDMLEYASSTRDKRVNLEAFSRIMADVRAL